MFEFRTGLDRDGKMDMATVPRKGQQNNHPNHSIQGTTGVTTGPNISLHATVGPHDRERLC